MQAKPQTYTIRFRMLGVKLLQYLSVLTCIIDVFQRHKLDQQNEPLAYN